MIKPSDPMDELLIVMPDSISDVGVGRRIADLRHAAGLSQLSLGRAAGRTQNWVAQLESGRRRLLDPERGWW